MLKKSGKHHGTYEHNRVINKKASPAENSAGDTFLFIRFI